MLAPDGRIIMVPRKAKAIGVFDPANSSFSLIDVPQELQGTSEAPETNKFAGGVLAQGHIYLVPSSLEVIGDFNPATGAFQTIDISAAGTTDKKYNGGVLAANGHVIMMPYDAGNIGDFDPQTATFATVDLADFPPPAWDTRMALVMFSSRG